MKFLTNYIFTMIQIKRYIEEPAAKKIKLDDSSEDEELQEEEEEKEIPKKEEKKEFDIKKENVWIMGNARIPIEKSCLNEKLINVMKNQMKITEFFPVQRAVVPIILALHNSETNGDILVGSPTGSGKT
jgi:superfamily II DNA/RNA helicase